MYLINNCLLQPKRGVAWIKADEELEKHQTMLRLVHNTSSNEETADAADVDTEMDEIPEDEDTENENKPPLSKKVRVSLVRISESDVHNFSETIEDQNVSESTAIPFPVTHGFI